MKSDGVECISSPSTVDDASLYLVVDLSYAPYHFAIQDRVGGYDSTGSVPAGFQCLPVRLTVGPI